MNTRYWGIAAILSGIGYGIYSLFTASGKLQFGTLKFKSKTIDLSGIHINLLFPIVNTDKKTSLPFDGFKGALMYGTHELAKINITDKLMIKAKSTVNLNVTIDISFFKVGAEITDIIKGGDFLNELNVTGVLTGGGFNYTVKEKVF